MTLTVVSKPVQAGDVTAQPPLTNPSTNEGAYYPTDNVILTATAKSGYRFVKWTGDVAEIEDATQSTIVVPMHDYYVDTIQDMEIIANFETIFPWEWVVGAGMAALLVAMLALTIVLRRRTRPQVDPDLP